MSATVTILVTGTDVEQGVWCDNCALPSASIVGGVLSDEQTLRPVGRFRVKACHDCGATAPASNPSTQENK